MTTIAVKDGIMAADSQDTRLVTVPVMCQKLYRFSDPDSIVGVTGDEYSIEQFLRWWVEGDWGTPPNWDTFDFSLEDEAPDFECLVLFPDGELCTISEHCVLSTITTPFFALGTGSSIAIGAMAAGKTAAEAIAIAIDHDIFTGGAVVTMSHE